MEYSVQVNGIPWRNGVKYVKLVVGYSLLVEVSVHGGMLTMASSWCWKKVITPGLYLYIFLHGIYVWLWTVRLYTCKIPKCINVFDYGMSKGVITQKIIVKGPCDL
jgi:hypothetical protein